MQQGFPGRSLLLKTLSTALLAIGMGLPALAEPARVVGSSPGSQVNIRTEPSLNAPSPSYGLVGDRVEVLTRANAADGFLWYYVSFPSGVRGWIRSDFIQLETATTPTPTPGTAPATTPTPAPGRWAHTYVCGAYTVTLTETGRDQYSYSSRSSEGNLNLSNGQRIGSGYSWNYEFVNANTVYVLEDAWDSSSAPGGFAELRVFQNGNPVLRQNCSK
ncbi:MULTISPECIES: SH3 domain-containing protein [unclassified Leptolyngbya]|uniref:SH3 domain-containing protein n=1 Tax=unclassified Leptolyngbya TaxID=2650499 RepID=UPI001687B9DE|nr:MULTISPECIES: SH3 domain-containing protein [unclassified Leptolyngbya]MBD1911852.1 SH3 domain-containing protein [Leptolyngbya sp. FACHB-8]MBD2156061.1 SH3 domain-containing protein [Leptolyngbya sp. FACHB-16]